MRFVWACSDRPPGGPPTTRRLDPGGGLGSGSPAPPALVVPVQHGKPGQVGRVSIGRFPKRMFGAPMGEHVCHHRRVVPASSVPLLLVATLLAGAIPSSPDGDPSAEPSRTVSLHRAKGMRRVGAALMSVGGALGLGATFLFVLDPCDPEPGQDCRLKSRATPALALGVPAGALLTAGAVLLGLGHARVRRLQLSFVSQRRLGWSAVVGVRF